MIPNIFRKFPKTFEECRRLPRKIQRCFNLILIYFDSLSMKHGKPASWLDKNDITHFYPHVWYIIFLNLLPYWTMLTIFLYDRVAASVFIFFFFKDPGCGPAHDVKIFMRYLALNRISNRLRILCLSWAQVRHQIEFIEFTIVNYK